MGSVIDKILALPYDNLYLYPVIDSYSKDRTEEIIGSYEKTGRVKCIFYKESRGVISCYLQKNHIVSAITSISTSAPLGKVLTATAERAG